MQVVGIDFGTTNVRIATWDSEQDFPPEPKLIGAQGTTTMPAVIALERGAEGKITITVGEAAEDLPNNSNTLVIPNIKRYVLSGDAYVDWHLEARNVQEENPKWPPKEWNPKTRCIQAWGQDFPVWDLIGRILAEALRRADITGKFEWRVGCPVHANYEYRAGLSQTLTELTGTGNVACVVEEPILFLTLARRLGDLSDGSYLVYDVGGGSFDSALVEVTGTEMLVYGADGHPLLGGSDIDDGLIERLDYNGQPVLMRRAKERLTPWNTTETLPDGTVVTWDNVVDTLKQKGFVVKSFSTMRDAYIGAKVLWKRGEGSPPSGEIIERREESGVVRFVWQLMWDDMAQDVHQIILFGGPTRSPYFSQNLASRFGEDKVATAAELLPALTGTPDLELVGISMGACYSYADSYLPLYLSRLPADILLEDRQTGEKVGYEPYEHFGYAHAEQDTGPRVVRKAEPFAPYFSNRLIQEKSDPHEYELTVAHPNGVVMRDPDDSRSAARYVIDGYLKPDQEERKQSQGFIPRLSATSLRLVIDRFGRVGVEKHSNGPGLAWTETFWLVTSPPWQTPLQKKSTELSRVLENIKKADPPESSNFLQGDPELGGFRPLSRRS